MTIRVLLTIALAVITAAAGPAAQGVRPGFYIVGSFSGSSMGDGAAIWKARIQGTGAVYVPGFNPALELVVRRSRAPRHPSSRMSERCSRPMVCTASVQQTNRT